MFDSTCLPSPPWGGLFVLTGRSNAAGLREGDALDIVIRATEADTLLLLTSEVSTAVGTPARLWGATACGAREHSPATMLVL
jgi:hypothetical protein